MADQVEKPAPPTEADWRQAIDDFKRYRDFDGKKFREGIKQLVPALKREAKSVYDAAAQIERQEPGDPAAHDGSAIITDRLKGYTTEQLNLAGLDLLRLDPIDPWLRHADPYGVMSIGPTSAFVFGNPDEEALARQSKGINESRRWGLDIFAKPTPQRPVVLLRLQAERLLEGAARVQQCIDHHKQRLAAIKRAGTKGYPSVATHDLLETAERWNVETREIAERLFAAKVLPVRESEHDDPVEQWYRSLKRARSEWRDRWKHQRQREQRQAAKADRER